MAFNREDHFSNPAHVGFNIGRCRIGPYPRVEGVHPESHRNGNQQRLRESVDGHPCLLFWWERIGLPNRADKAIAGVGCYGRSKVVLHEAECRRNIYVIERSSR